MEFTTIWISSSKRHFEFQIITTGPLQPTDYYYFEKSNFTTAIGFMIPAGNCCYFTERHQVNLANWLKPYSPAVSSATTAAAITNNFKNQHYLATWLPVTIIDSNFIIN